MTGETEHEARARILYEVGFLNLYPREAIRLARGIVSGIDRVFEIAPEHFESGADHLVSGELADAIDDVLGRAAKLDALLSDERKKGSKPGMQLALEKERVGWLQALIGNPALPVIAAARRVRNRLEHFDEYLDQTALRLQSGELVFPRGVALDLATTRTVLERRPLYPLRLYVIDERVFAHADLEVNLGELQREAQLVADSLQLKAEESGNPGLTSPDSAFIAFFGDEIRYPPVAADEAKEEGATSESPESTESP